MEVYIYQLIGDNWDKNILPSYRTLDKGTLSLHLFNVIAVQDRVPFLDKQLMKELTFLLATSIVNHNTHLNKVFKSIYPHHLEHEFSHFSGLKTTQVSNTTYNINIVPTNCNESFISHMTFCCNKIYIFAVEAKN